MKYSKNLTVNSDPLSSFAISHSAANQFGTLSTAGRKFQNVSSNSSLLPSIDLVVAENLFQTVSTGLVKIAPGGTS